MIKTEPNHIKELLKETPLKIRLDVLNQMFMIDLISELGYREDTMWKPEEQKILNKLCKHAHKLTRAQLKTIKEWEYDKKSK